MTDQGRRSDIATLEHGLPPVSPGMNRALARPRMMMLAASSPGARNGPCAEPVSRLLVRLRAQEVTCRVHVSDPSRHAHVIYLRRGRPVHIAGVEAKEHLGHLLVEAGIVPAEAIDRALERPN